MATLVVATLLLGIWPLSSGKEIHMSGASIVPAASAKLKLERDKDNRNTKLDLKVSHLAKPSSLSPPASIYLVWVQPPNGDATKLG
jgi:hypothetical protein